MFLINILRFLAFCESVLCKNVYSIKRYKFERSFEKIKDLLKYVNIHPLCMLNPENQRKFNSIYACIHTYVSSASDLRYYFLSFLVIILFFNKIIELIPRPARACPDPPMYLRLRMGRPIGKSIPLPTSVMSYGKNKLRPEYWFSVPQNR